MATWNGICGASSDDAKQAGTTVTLTDAPIALTAGTHWAGLRFPSCPIANSETINSAVLTLELTAGSTDPGNLVIYGENVDDSATFTTTNNDISGRTRTTASVTWTAGAQGAGDKNAPDLAAILAEITTRAGYAAGNDVALIFDATASTSLRFTSYDTSTSLCARLTVDYGGGGQPKAARGRLVPGMGRAHGQQGW